MAKRNWGIYWDYEKNIPIILEKNLQDRDIKSKKLLEIAQDLRPVFLEEKHLLKNLFNLEDNIYYKSVWCTKQGRYIIDGTPFKESIVKRINNLSNFDEFRIKVLDFKKSNEMVLKENQIFQDFIEENKNHMKF